MNKLLVALKIAAPAEWRDRVRCALLESGNVPGAAKRLGVTSRTVYRWIHDDSSLIDGIDLPAAGNPNFGDDRE